MPDGVEVVVMDGFSGLKTATIEELPDGDCGHGPVPRRRAGRRCAGPFVVAASNGICTGMAGGEGPCSTGRGARCSGPNFIARSLLETCGLQATTARSRRG